MKDATGPRANEVLERKTKEHKLKVSCWAETHMSMEERGGAMAHESEPREGTLSCFAVCTGRRRQAGGEKVDQQQRLCSDLEFFWCLLM